MSAALRYVFLVLEGHPYAREMLRSLLAAGLAPLAIIEERSAVAAQEAAKFRERMAGFELAPTFTEQLGDHPEVRRVVVPHHNKDACAEALAQLAPDLLVLGGTRILRPRIFALAKHTLNAHPGLLPELRGSASVAWAFSKWNSIGRRPWGWGASYPQLRKLVCAVTPHRHKHDSSNLNP